MFDLAIIIVSYNTRDLLRDCLASVYDNRGDFRFQVCVVDNCSSDDSAGMVRTEFPQARLIESDVNGGFAYGNNLGLRSFGFTEVEAGDAEMDPSPAHNTPVDELPNYVLLLNSDTILPPSALAGMLEFMDAHPEAGASGPRLVLADGSLDLACRRSFPTPEVALYRLTGLSKLFPHSRRFGRYNLTYLAPDEMAEVDSVVGACMIVRREAIQQVGLLDENFWMYGEDLDWAYRMKSAGWKVLYNPEVTVLHYKEASSRDDRAIRPKTRYEFYRAMFVFYQKHYAATTPFWLGWLIVGGIVLRGGMVMIGEILRNGNKPSIEEVAR
ncbi:MAG: glycosyltransferase family 2 protein [Chloroflexota bacterium]|nr:glycosyltransferase family 2 protein [Chloroflexota bacterium]